jgi:hypothetical protein
MKFAVIGIFGSVFAMGSADPVVQYGALAILGGAVLYLLKYTIPALLKRSDQELKRHLEAEERSRRDFIACLGRQNSHLGPGDHLGL